MTLLFDENLSPHLTSALADCYRIRDIGSKSQPDGDVWTFAAREDLAIVTKDSDFRQRSFLYGYPPKVIWIGFGNCSTRKIENILRSRQIEVAEFLENPSKAYLAFTGK